MGPCVEEGERDMEPIRTRPPQDYGALRQDLLNRYEGLPSQLRIVAQYLIDNPNDAALMTIAALSQATGVQPSAFIRFSKAIGFNGFSDIQTILRQNLQQRQASYAARVAGNTRNEAAGLAPLERYSALAAQSVNALASSIEQEQLDAAVAILQQARLVHVVGHRRAWPVAAYFAYMIAGFGAETHLFSPAGAMVETNVSLIKPGDAMLAISFPQYSTATLEFVEQARSRDVPVIAITNTLVSPIARQARLAFEVDQDTTDGFRSAAGAMTLAQVLAISYGEAKGGQRTGSAEAGGTMTDRSGPAKA